MGYSGQDRSLVRGAHEVGVRRDIGIGSARAAQHERLLAIERLQPRRKRAAGVFIVNLYGDVYLNPSERIDDGLEAVEVYLCEMRDLDPRKLRHGFHRQSRTAERSGGIDFLNAVFSQVNFGVTRNRHQSHLLVHRIDPSKHNAVAAVDAIELTQLVT